MSRSADCLLLGLLVAACSAPACAEKADRDQPVRLEADRVSLDEVGQTSVFEGKVELVQGTLLIRAERIVVKQDAQGYKHCTATGRTASFRQKPDGADGFMEGYGERIEYDMRAGTVDFFGQARVKRARDDLQGEHIAYSTRTEVFKASGDPNESDDPDKGRVHAVIQTAPAKPASAVQGEAPLAIQPSSTLTQPKSKP
jgi:lipopolysaccharide export system protein LptA